MPQVTFKTKSGKTVSFMAKGGKRRKRQSSKRKGKRRASSKRGKRRASGKRRPLSDYNRFVALYFKRERRGRSAKATMKAAAAKWRSM